MNKNLAIANRSCLSCAHSTLSAVSYSPSIVTMAVSVAVCEIFSVKEWCDLENRIRVRSRSLKMAPFDRLHSYSSSTVTMAWFVFEKTRIRFGVSLFQSSLKNAIWFRYYGYLVRT